MSWIIFLTPSLNKKTKYNSQNDGGIGNNGSSHLNYSKILFAHINQGKEGNPHGTKPSLKNGNGDET